MVITRYAVAIMESSGFESVKQVILVARNGYINRLQAMASSAILAESIGADFHVSWESEPAAPGPPEFLFELASFLSETFVRSEEVERLLGCSINEFPRYVTHRVVPEVGPVVVIAGHDRGEQPLMGELSKIVGTVNPVALVIAAGGRFSLQAGSKPVTWDSHDFRSQRAQWYQKIAFTPEIELACSQSMGEPSLGLHLRYSDRSHQTPSRREISKAVSRLVESTGITRIFVASDSRRERERWIEKLRRMGLDGWSFSSDTIPGSENHLVNPAMVDWRILSNTAGSVFFSKSSFGYEAAVASGFFGSSIGLDPNSLVSVRARLEKQAAILVGTPKRRGWIS